jgi:hypothetical protein
LKQNKEKTEFWKKREETSPVLGKHPNLLLPLSLHAAQLIGPAAATRPSFFPSRLFAK